MPEIFRLKAKRQAHTVVGEESFQVGIHRLMRTQHGEHLEQAGLNQVLPAQEGAFQARLHARELGAVLVEETAEAGSVTGRKRGDLPLHRRNVRRAVELAARAELDPVLRIQPHHFDFGAQAGSGGLEDFLQHARVKEESRPEIELVAVRLDAGGASADDGQTFEDFYLQASRRQQNGGSQSARTSANDESLFSHEM